MARFRQTKNASRRKGKGKGKGVDGMKKHMREQRKKVLKKYTKKPSELVTYDKRTINPEMLEKAYDYPKALPGKTKKGLMVLHNLYRFNSDFHPALDAISHAFFDDVVGRLHTYHRGIAKKCITTQMVEYVLDRAFNMKFVRVNNGTYFLCK